MIEAHNLSRIADIRHGFFTRRGGCSTGIYASLNCGLGSRDEPESVARNRLHVATSLGLSAGELLTVYQVHSPTVVTVTSPWTRDDTPKADAMATATPGVGLGILTADCAPVLFADGAAGVIGAAHAGWRGALGGVCEATIAAMAALGARADRIAVAIGPTISKANYEVGAEFHAAFLAESPGLDRFFTPSSRAGRHMFDLPGFIEHRLAAAGVASIERIDLCTYAGEEDFFSYRRATHRNEPDYGRQISAITLGPGAFLKED
jgi:hypothetical protein